MTTTQTEAKPRIFTEGAGIDTLETFEGVQVRVSQLRPGMALLDDLGCAVASVDHRIARRAGSVRFLLEDLESGGWCPQTGYRYGAAWLYEPIPDDVLARMRSFVTGLPENARQG